MIIVPGSTSTKLAKNLSTELQIPCANVETKRFPDDEAYVRIDSELTNEVVVLIQNTYPDDNIIELFLLQDAISEYEIMKLFTVIPYFGYSRQDKKFNPGEPISARTLARHIELNSDEVILADLHAKSILKWFTKPVHEVSGMAQIGEFLKQYSPDIIMAPDKGAIERASVVAKVLGADFDYLEKTRIDGHTVSIKAKTLDVKGRSVAIIDDIIATGGTIIKATDELKRQGATNVFAACTHGLYTGGAMARLSEHCDKIISTDTLESETSLVSIAPSLKEIIK
ncbi:ribose-phosphate diphosphokinase [[Eubacterium] cellulosolvens]